MKVIMELPDNVLDVLNIPKDKLGAAEVKKTINKWIEVRKVKNLDEVKIMEKQR